MLHGDEGIARAGMPLLQLESKAKLDLTERYDECRVDPRVPLNSSSFLTEHASRLRKEAECLESRSWNRGVSDDGSEDSRALRFHAPLHLVTYATNTKEIYKRDARDLFRHANETQWFDSLTRFGPDDLPRNFVEQYHDILSYRRGGGSWFWRFPIIERVLETTPIGDFILYADSDCSIWNTPAAELTLKSWISRLAESEHDFLRIEQGHLEELWTTPAVFQAFGVAEDNESIRKSGQLYGGIFIMRNGPNARRALSFMYNAIVRDPYMVTDKYSEDARRVFPGFRDARHDQSIQSVALKLFGFVKVSFDEADVSIQNQTLPICSRQFLGPQTKKKHLPK